MHAPRSARYRSAVPALAGALILAVLTGPVARRPLHASHPVRHHPAPAVVFEENLGQAAPDVRFLARGDGYRVYLTDREAVIVADEPAPALPRATEASALMPRHRRLDAHRDPPAVRTVRIGFGTGKAEAAGEQPAPGRSHYLRGTPERWVTGARQYSRVRVPSAQPDVDVTFYGAGRHVEYDLDLAAGRDPGDVSLTVTGADALEIDGDGRLVMRAGPVTLVQPRPVAWQQQGDQRRPVEARYALRAEGTVGFEIAAWDPALPLTIDPVIVSGTYLGGSGDDYPYAVATDADGAIYVTGETASADYPVAGAVQGAAGQVDAFVTKLAADGVTVLYSTYLGGSGGDRGYGLAVDALGSVVLAGGTASTDFPTVNALQGDQPGDDGFVLRLSAAGDAILWSTYLGGSDRDEAFDVRLDAAGRIVVAGATKSADLPLAGSIQPWQGGWDAFVARYAADGSALDFGTWYGGTSTDVAATLGLGSDGSVYLTGYTDSDDLPVPGAWHGRGGSVDGFAARIDPEGGTLVWGTYVGGAGWDAAFAVRVDADDAAYVGGYTDSEDFPTAGPTATSLQWVDGFVVKLDAAGNAVYSVHVGGSEVDTVYALSVDPLGAVYATGVTGSTDLPQAQAVQARFDDCDAFVARLNGFGALAHYATFLGATGCDSPVAIALTADAHVVAGYAWSSDLPVTGAPAGGGADGFVFLIANPTDAAPVAAAAVEQVVANETFAGHVSASDADADGLRFTLVTPPDRGTVALDPATGAFQYTPPAGEGGVDAFTFSASDGLLESAPATVTLVIAAGVPASALSGDYDGDGAANLATFDAASGAWAVEGQAPVVAGQAGDVPVPADYDGDGRADRAAFRPADGGWTVNGASAGTLGGPGDLPAVADYDGDGRADRAVFRPSTGTWHVGAGPPVSWGTAGDRPVPADYTGDRRADLAVFRPWTGVWYVQGLAPVQWGKAGDVPVPADYDGDGVADYAVFRPSTGTWFIRGLATVGFGAAGDLPLALDLSGDGRAELVAFRPSTGQWFVWNLASGQGSVRSFGPPGVLPAQLPVWLRAAVRGDADGDRRADRVVFRPGTGTWFLTRSAGAAAFAVSWGASGDVPVAGDYDGDHRLDVAVYRPTTGTWYLRRSSDGFATSIVRAWGAPGDRAVPADVDGDGRTDLVVFRPSNGTWYWLLSSSGFTAWGARQWGQSGDEPHAGDVDGDGRADLAVYRPSTGVWHIARSAAGFASAWTLGGGDAGDVPALLDLDGDGRLDPALFRAATGRWTVRLSGAGFGTATAAWGASGDVPVAADVDGDGRMEPAVFRPASGAWYVLGQAPVVWGQPGDLPAVGR